MTPFRCWQAGRLGSIAPGKAADLIAVAGDPLRTSRCCAAFRR
jgi:imidazolonepropionase-like amidohydrolase